MRVPSLTELRDPDSLGEDFQQWKPIYVFPTIRGVNLADLGVLAPMVVFPVSQWNRILSRSQRWQYQLRGR